MVEENFGIRQSETPLIDINFIIYSFTMVEENFGIRQSLPYATGP